MNWTKRAFLLGVLALVGCATAPHLETQNQFISIVDPKAKELSAQYLKQVSLHQIEALGNQQKNCRLPEKTEKWNKQFEQASACAAVEKWQLVKEIGERLTLETPDSPWGAYFLSLAAKAEGHHQRAQWLLDLSERKTGSEWAVAYYQRGLWFEQNHASSLAVAAIKKAVALDNQLSFGHLWLGQMYNRERAFQDAKVEFLLALQGEESVDALKGLIHASYQLGESKQAEPWVNRLIKLKPEFKTELEKSSEAQKRAPAHAGKETP